MTFTTAGLANAGVTTHYGFQYDDSLQQSPTNPNGPEPARTNLVITACDSDFSLMSLWFRNISLDVNLPVQVKSVKSGARTPPKSRSVVPGAGQNVEIIVLV